MEIKYKLSVKNYYNMKHMMLHMFKFIKKYATTDIYNIICAILDKFLTVS